MTNLVQDSEFLEYVRIRKVKAEPVQNTIQAEQEGVPLETLGYCLHGPRGSRKMVVKESDGTINLGPVKLWLDGIEYATNALAMKRLRKKGAF